MSVLVAYAQLQPWRGTVRDHLYSFRRYGTRPYEYVNLAVPGLARAYARRRYDAVLWHNTVLAWLRWAPEDQQRGLLGRARALRAAGDCHVALPQDEFIHAVRVNAFLRELGVRHVFSVAPPSEWPAIYAGLDGVEISEALTGYLDDATVARIDAIVAEGRPRTIDIGYRTVPAKPYLGRHAMLKAGLAEEVAARAPARGLRVDLSTRAEDTFYGDDWYRFLAASRYTIGIEGGASILDRDGSVQACVDGQPPGLAFDELEARCFPGRDGELALFAVSPRHLEACATRTVQILVEGSYSGVLQPGVHYLELKRDLSNLDAVLDTVAAADSRAIAERAYADIVASGRFTYRRLVEDVERVLPAARGGRRPILAQAVDTGSHALIPLATRVLMPARRRVLAWLR
jgi:hypothetical protein